MNKARCSKTNRDPFPWERIFVFAMIMTYYLYRILLTNGDYIYVELCSATEMYDTIFDNIDGVENH
jgi:hypothetical protein